MAAAGVPKNQLTGKGSGFLTEFMRIEPGFTLDASPVEIKTNSLVASILHRYEPIRGVTGNTMTQLQLADISDGHQEEVMDLLRLGLGAVSEDESIWLADPLVRTAYSSDADSLKNLLVAMVGGRLDALVANRPKFDDLELTRRIDEEIAETEALLEKIRSD